MLAIHQSTNESKKAEPNFAAAVIRAIPTTVSSIREADTASRSGRLIARRKVRAKAITTASAYQAE